jgi:hypothetical protein
VLYSDPVYAVYNRRFYSVRIGNFYKNWAEKTDEYFHCSYAVGKFDVSVRTGVTSALK